MNPMVFVIPVLIVLAVKGLLAYVRFRKGRSL